MARDRGGQASHEELVAAVFEVSYRRLVVQLTSVAGHRAEAEEAVQEAFTRAVAAGPSWREVANPEAWLRVVALNVLRTRARRTGLLRRVAPLLPSPAPGRDASDDHLGIVAAMRSLPRDQREVLALHYFADLRVADIATELDLPVGTVKSRLARGREALARLLPTDVEEGRRV